MANTSSERLLARLKGLQAQMHEGEWPLFSIPAIWENATEKQSNACDLVLTNQRLFGYIYTRFPRERLFLDALELADMRTVSVRQKSFDVVFRELFVSDGEKNIYIRAPRKKIEQIYSALRDTIQEYVSATPVVLEPGDGDTDRAGVSGKVHTPPSYSRQRVQQSLERSPMGISFLLVGGLLLEVIGVLAWTATRSLQTGMPLFLAGLVAVIVATLARRQLR